MKKSVLITTLVVLSSVSMAFAVGPNDMSNKFRQLSKVEGSQSKLSATTIQKLLEQSRDLTNKSASPLNEKFMQVLKENAAQGGVNAGGGHEVGLHFEAMYIQALELLKSDKDLAPFIQSHRLEQDLEKLTILILDADLEVQMQDFVQNSVAVNLPQLNLILVNPKRWKDIQDQRLLQAIALHEVASTRGLESTGNYFLSARFLAKFGGNVESLKKNLTVNPVKQVQFTYPEALPHEVLKNIFEATSEPARFEDFDDIMVIEPTKTCYSFSATNQNGTYMDLRHLKMRKNMTKASEDRGPLFPSKFPDSDKPMSFLMEFNAQGELALFKGIKIEAFRSSYEKETGALKGAGLPANYSVHHNPTELIAGKTFIRKAGEYVVAKNADNSYFYCFKKK